MSPLFNKVYLFYLFIYSSAIMDNKWQSRGCLLYQELTLYNMSILSRLTCTLEFSINLNGHCFDYVSLTRLCNEQERKDS